MRGAIGAVLVALALLSMVRSACAQQADLTRVRIAELVKQAPQSKVAEAQVDVARASVTAAGIVSLDNPVLSGMGGFRFKQDGSRPFAGTATLSWPIDLGGKRGSRQQAALADQREAQAGSDSQRRRLLLAALLMHATVLRDEVQLALVQARQANSEKLLTSARKRREAGTVPELDVSLATLQQGRDTAAVSSATGDRDASLLRLAALLGQSGATGVAAGRLVPDEEPPRLEQMLRQIEQRADVRAAAARVQAAQARAARERSAGAPTISLLAQYERDDGDNIGTIGVALPIPILNANTIAKSTSSAEAKASQSEYAAVRAAAEGEIRELYTRYEATKRAREQLAPTAKAVKESVALALRTYELGESDLASVLLVHREVLEAERALLEVEYAHASAKIELLVAAGRTPQ